MTRASRWFQRKGAPSVSISTTQSQDTISTAPPHVCLQCMPFRVRPDIAVGSLFPWQSRALIGSPRPQHICACIVWPHPLALSKAECNRMPSSFTCTITHEVYYMSDHNQFKKKKKMDIFFKTHFCFPFVPIYRLFNFFLKKT